MYFQRIYDEDLAQASYLIGCQVTGDAVVVDARRDIEAYLALAEKENLTITHVTETHIHADYLSGSRELAAATGATLHLSTEGGTDWAYRFAHQGLEHGDKITVGNLTLEARHTPGHTPEHLSFLLTDGATTDKPGFFLTGDFVFVGDLGRPDLLDEAGLGQETREPNARRLFKSLREEFLTLPDYVQVWPAHGAGSACGKALGAVASTTVGYEKLSAWWASYAQNNDEDGFVRALLEGQPDAPRYFSRMKRQNRGGPALLGQLEPLPEVQAADIADEINHSLIFIDTRSTPSYEAAAVPGALHIPAGKTFVTYASFILDPEVDARPMVLLAADARQAEALRARLLYIGADNLIGFTRSVKGLGTLPIDTITPEALDKLERPFILDIRTESEYQQGHIPGATRIHAGRVMGKLDALPKKQTLYTHCQSGARNTVVSSALRAAGFKVTELAGSFLAYKAWRDAVPA